MELTPWNISQALDRCTSPNEGFAIMREWFPDYSVYLTINGEFLAQNIRDSAEPTRRFRLVEVTD